MLAVAIFAVPAVAHGGQVGTECGDILGRAFNNLNRNDTQDTGEKGLAGVVLVALDGGRTTTDSFGSYHIGCVEIPAGQSHRRAIVKIDRRSLPGDTYPANDGLRVANLVAGKATTLNFALVRKHDVRMYVHSTAFVDNAKELKPSWLTGIDRLIAVLELEPSTLKMTYFRGRESLTLAHQRTSLLKQTVEKSWQMAGRDEALPIEILMVQPQ